ncbi:MAG: hypothetical protein M3336_05665 [Chloroflexota bacterium]|nr:hypothetical protein [Chloroflexota bacterium]
MQSELIERKDSYFRVMEAVPTQVYLSAALASIGTSAVLRLLGFKDMALFVGQWPPTFLLMAMVHKILRPSAEQGFDQSREAGQAARDMLREP